MLIFKAHILQIKLANKSQLLHFSRNISKILFIYKKDKSHRTILYLSHLICPTNIYLISINYNQYNTDFNYDQYNIDFC